MKPNTTGFENPCIRSAKSSASIARRQNSTAPRRSENTEASHIQHQLSLQAIGHPHIGFVSIRDQRIVFQAPPAGTLAERIQDLRGLELFEQLLEIQPEPADGITISGFVARPGVSRSTRVEQILFVNEDTGAADLSADPHDP